MRATTLPALLLALVIAGSACSDSSSTTTGVIADPRGPPFGVTVAAVDLAFEPAEWTVPSGAVLVVDFSNQAAVEHYWVIVAEGRVESAADLDDSLILFELRADPGGSSSGTLQAPGGASELQVICKVPGHLEAGMEGRLVLEP